jgi:hypothetical protein
MNYNDLIGTAGVGLILLAYGLSTLNVMNGKGKIFYGLNVLGSGLACYASWLIDYLPFVILEGVWFIVSLAGLVRARRINPPDISRGS